MYERKLIAKVDVFSGKTWNSEELGIMDSKPWKTMTANTDLYT